MAKKYFGKLAGKTNAAQTAVLSAAPNVTTPYATAVGSKFISVGESANSATINRALTALQANIEHTFTALDGIALRDEIIMPITAVDDIYGANDLAGLNTGDAEIDTAALDASSRVPIYWLYVGLASNRLNEVLAVYSNLGAAAYQTPLAIHAALSAKVVISTVGTRVGATFTNYFPAQTFSTASPHAIPDCIPGIVPVAPAFSPYGGTAKDYAVSFSSDGATLTDGTIWRDQYARPGCFVQIKAALGNNGVYRIAAVTGSAGKKVVLTTGGLHRVFVESLTNLTTGDLVSWQLPGSAGTDRDYCAYVMFKYDDVAMGTKSVWLSTFQLVDNYPKVGKVHGMKTGSATGMHTAFGDVGTGDQEVSGDVGLVAGSKLYIKTTVNYVQVAAIAVPVIAAGTPMQFDTSQVDGIATLCAPPGFILNPAIVLIATSSPGGDYMVCGKCLSTVQEVLASETSNAQQLLGGPVITAKYDNARLYSLLAYMKSGADGQISIGDTLTPPNMLLGENLWKLVVTPSAGTAASLLTPGTAYTFAHTTAGYNTKVTVVSASVNTIIVRDVYADAWPEKTNRPELPIVVGSIYTSGGGATLTVASLTMPSLLTADATTYVPRIGLDAAYNNHYGAAVGARGAGRGNAVLMATGRPLTLILPDVATQTGIKLTSLRTDITLVSAYTEVGVKLCSLDFVGTSLVFKDTNATSGIPLSDGGVGGANLPTGYSSILGAINYATVFEYTGAGTQIVRLKADRVVPVASTAKLVFPAQGITGAGVRFVFDAAARSVCAGTAIGTGWDAPGSSSIALGYGPVASGAYSVSLGEETVASAENAVAIGGKDGAGNPARATAAGAVCLGRGGLADGVDSTSIGVNSRSEGASSTAIGGGTTGSGAAWAVAIGPYALAMHVGEYAQTSLLTGNGLRKHQRGTVLLQTAIESGVISQYMRTDSLTNTGQLLTFDSEAAYHITVRACARRVDNLGAKVWHASYFVWYNGADWYISAEAPPVITASGIVDDLTFTLTTAPDLADLPVFKVSNGAYGQVKVTAAVDYVLAG